MLCLSNLQNKYNGCQKARLLNGAASCSTSTYTAVRSLPINDDKGDNKSRRLCRDEEVTLTLVPTMMWIKRRVSENIQLGLICMRGHSNRPYVGHGLELGGLKL